MKNFEDLEFILDNIDISNIEDTNKDNNDLDTLEKATDYEKKLNEKTKKILSSAPENNESPTIFPYGQNNKEKNITEAILEYDIKITPDEQQASISINYNPDFQLDYDFIINIIQKEGVVKGIITENINKILQDYNNKKNIKDILIAQGKMPETGKDAKFIFKFKNEPKLVKKYTESLLSAVEDETEKIEFEKNLKNSRILCGIVSKGEIIAVKKAPTKGEDGYTVKNKILPGRLGNDKKLRIKRNIKLNEKTNSYIADIDGEVIIDNDTIWIKRYSHGSFNLTVSPDEMKLLLTITPPVGDGKPVIYEDILNKINELDIKTDINTDAIKNALQESTQNSKPMNNIIVSEGITPINGEDSQLEYKIKLASGNKFKIDEKGNIDFKEQDLITLTNKDQLIAVLMKATKGKRAGITVTGKTIEPIPGNEFIYKAGKNVKSVDYPDKIEYYSQESGHFKIDYDTFNIYPVLKIDEDVDFSVGNIKFNGDVIIHGNVNDEFSVFAEGDIIIYGNVGASFVEGKRNIIIKNGIIGKNRGKIICEKNLTARFMENGHIECEGNVDIEEAIINSNIFTNSNLIITKGKGQVIGGKIWAGHKIIANNLGSPTGVKTEITLGYNFKIKFELRKIKNEKEKYINSLKKLDDIIKSLFKTTTDIKKFSEKMKTIYTEAIRKKAIILSYLSNLKTKENSLYTTKLIIDVTPEIIVKENIYSDVKINYLNKIINITDKYRKVKIKKDDKTIKIMNLN